MTVEDMGHFLADRYYTGKVQKELFEDIITGVKKNRVCQVCCI